MKLDVNVLKFLGKEDFRVLTAVEVGQKNHELVPLPLIESIAALRGGGAQRSARNLLRYKLLHHDSAKYDGYRLTPLGYDYLAIKALVNRGAISSVGSQIGVGKESDVFEVMNDEGDLMALKLHRLGRTSFRAVKSKRDYLKHRSSFSWLYLSRLAAAREYSFMVALADQGLPVPKPIDNNRHAVLMSMVPAIPLAQVQELHRPGDTFHQLMALMERLTKLGLVHCDYNEFNLLVDEQDTVTLIDFPQMVSVSHENSQELFDRDVDCVIKFFKTKIGYIPEQDEARPWTRPVFEELRQNLQSRLDIELQASGHPQASKKGKASLSPLDPVLGLEAESTSATEDDAESDGEQTVAPQVHVPMKVSKQQSQRAQALPSQPTVSPTLNGRPLSRDLQQEMCLMQPLLQEPRLRLSGSLQQGAKSMQLMTAKQLLLWAVKISQPQGSPMQLKLQA
ncbi:hypothetical protein WJX84_002686 [Apatococcus fuscideae]|uniref:Serine/threonine-protein kinase RIO2 n=1 Tax=Apatococcus fuscideae TaxID=2026836 RepID=A0AAW1TAC0_9CHLO